MARPGSKRVAIVGSGCSGIGALWALKSSSHEVHLYESQARLGGHSNTVTFEHDGHKTKVDTGFIVLNSATYPNFIAFLKEIGVDTLPTDMTFGVSRDNGQFEWAGTSLGAVFAQRRNIFRLRTWRMIFDIIRFNQYALDLLAREDDSEEAQTNADGETTHKTPQAQESIGEYLDREGYSDAFRDDYLIPMTAAVWSTSPDKCSLMFPASTLIRFMYNHHLLTTVSARPEWRTLRDRSQAYIDAVMREFPNERIHLSSPITHVKQADNGKLQVSISGDREEEYDHVILATHGDQALQILGAGATAEEKGILEGFVTNKNVAVLHSDLRLMPKRRLAWSAWNYITLSSEKSSNVDQVCLTYWMNLLQHIPESKFGPVLVTLNPIVEPKPELTQGRWEYAHPLYNSAAIRSQSLLPRIQNVRGISFAGAWTKYGFHEDGFSSGIKVAIDHLDAKVPFDFVDSTFSRGKKPELGLADKVLRVVIQLIRLTILIWMILMGSLGSARSRVQQLYQATGRDTASESRKLRLE